MILRSRSPSSRATCKNYMLRDRFHLLERAAPKHGLIALPLGPRRAKTKKQHARIPLSVALAREASKHGLRAPSLAKELLRDRFQSLSLAPVERESAKHCLRSLSLGPCQAKGEESMLRDRFRSLSLAPCRAREAPKHGLRSLSRAPMSRQL